MSTAVAARPIGARRGPGRPRDDDLDRMLVDATLALIDEGQQVTLGAVVARSGTSRAALYRRWPSLTALIATALDVGRTMPPDYPDEQDLREAVMAGVGLSETPPPGPGFSEERFRQRIRLVMSDRALQKAYWDSHVSRRRAPLERALRRGVEQGTLRADLDVQACFDALAGVAYYQFVVRGDGYGDPGTRARMRAAVDVIWRGMLA